MTAAPLLDGIASEERDTAAGRYSAASAIAASKGSAGTSQA